MSFILTAVKFIRPIPAVLQPIAVLGVVVTGPVSTRLLSASWVICIKNKLTLLATKQSLFMYLLENIIREILSSDRFFREKSLTAAVLIRVVHTVLHVVTPVFARDTLALPAGELVWTAGAST